MEQRKLGKTGPSVGSFGLGCMGMSGMCGPADRAESVATIQEALDAGVTLFDTGDFYGMGHNEMLVAEALKGGRRDKAILSVKFGALLGPAGGWSGADARPAAVKNSLFSAAFNLTLSADDLKAIEAAVPKGAAAGDRYPPHMAALLKHD